MGLFKRRAEPPLVLEGRREVCIVGESFHQPALLSIAGPKPASGVCHGCLATLIADPKNQYDANAVGVYIDGKQVGNLSREHAALICERVAARRGPCIVRAQINGGWDRGDGDVGYFGVVIWLPDVQEI